MMIAGEREFLKAYERLEQLVEDVGQAGKQGRRIDEVERMLFAELLAMGLDLLRAFVAAAGDGDVGKTVEVPARSESAPDAANSEPTTAARTLRRLPAPHARRYVSIFGELTVRRFV